MSKTEILAQIRQLPEQERREFTEQFFEEFGRFNDELSPGQIAKLERRVEELKAHPELGIPWEVVKAELHERLKSRKALIVESFLPRWPGWNLRMPPHSMETGNPA